MTDTTQSLARDSTLTNQQTTDFYKNSTATLYRPPETQTVTWPDFDPDGPSWKSGRLKGGIPPFSRKQGVDILAKNGNFW